MLRRQRSFGSQTQCLLGLLSESSSSGSISSIAARQVEAPSIEHYRGPPHVMVLSRGVSGSSSQTGESSSVNADSMTLAPTLVQTGWASQAVNGDVYVKTIQKINKQ